MGLIRSIRIYANRCPYCGKRMRLYSWTTAPFALPTLTSARVCPGKHYMRTEHYATGRIQEFEEQGRPIAELAEVTEFPDPLEGDKPLHSNLNIPLRKPPAPARPAAAAPPPATTPATTAAVVAVPAAPTAEPAKDPA